MGVGRQDKFLMMVEKVTMSAVRVLSGELGSGYSQENGMVWPPAVLDPSPMKGGCA